MTARRSISLEHLEMESTSDALQRFAGIQPHATALIADRFAMSYKELVERAHRFARELVSRNVQAIALLADNSIDWVTADVAAQLARVTVVPIPAFFSTTQIQHALRDCGAELLIADCAAMPSYRPLPFVRIGSLGERLDLYRLPSKDLCPVPAKSIAKISYTAGTTGEPKGAYLPQSAMDRVAASLVDATADLGLRRHLCLLPLATLLENVAGVFASLRSGGEICVPSLETVGWTGAAAFDARRLLDCINRFQPDSAILVPQMLAGVIEALEHGAPVPESLIFLTVAGTRVAPALVDRAHRLGLPVFEGYGLTEAASVVALSSPGQRRPGSVGRPLAHSKVRIDANGEIVVSGATYAGYVGETGTRCDVVRTGDLGYLDDDGYLYVLGRRKNVFITSFGRNVSPDWVEAEFLRASAIEQIAIFGENRPWNTAIVVPATDATTDQIRFAMTAVNATLPDYARVGDWIVAAEPFSASNGLLTGSGRNRRREIKIVYERQINQSYDNYVPRRA